MLKQSMMRCVTFGFGALAALVSVPSRAAELNLTDAPLFLAPSVAPLNMLVVGRDHKLYYEAYNDASDLNGDDELDVGYRGYLPNPTAAAPTNKGIDYYGYFDSYKCYTYTSDLFTPTRFTTTKQCGGANEWSGDYLNYLTMARIDALRKVLYGGKRDVDSASQTILIRSHIPMDAHSWGKEYSAEDPYDIRQYTPYSRPATGQRHLFANTTPNPETERWQDNNGLPRLRIMLDKTYRIWEWVSRESPVAGTRVSPAGGDDVSVTFSELTVRVEVCKSQALVEPPAGGKTTETCKQYPDGNYKPTGLLHEFGENDSMMFGLLTGSYTANKSGGVLRKNIGSITNEVNTATNGTLVTGVTGIIKTLDNLRVAGYTRYVDSGNNNNTPRDTSDDWTNKGGTSYDCGLPAMGLGPPTDGQCMMWGNPVAEMMYETLRYFRGKQPTGAFTAENGHIDVENSLGLPRPAWQDPYATERYPTCAKPFQTVMTDINNSYDTDQLPGSYFPLQTGGGLAVSRDSDDDLNVSTLASLITDNEPNVLGSHFIGQSDAEYDGSPLPKVVTDLGQVRGLAPEEPTKQGGYYAASVAYHGLISDANPRSDEKVQTFAVALASPLPQIKIPVGTTANPRFVTLVPFAKSVKYNAAGILSARGEFQPTNQIVDFYIESIAADQRSGTIRVNFEDVEAGNDHDMDAIVRYTYSVLANGTVQVDVSSDYEAGGIIHHIGYVISGVEDSGVYLVVQDCDHTGAGTADADYSCNTDDIGYFLDTPGTQRPFPNNTWDDGVALKGFSRRAFTPSTAGSGATVLQPPLWYAAKWGGFKDSNDNNIPDEAEEWDDNGDGDPDNYFLVTNALTLSQQLRQAFNEIINRSSSASAASVNSGAISTSTRIYQAKFDTENWTGDLFALGLNADGSLNTTTPVWSASRQIPTAANRKIYTLNSDNSKVEFKWDTLDATRKTQLNADPAVAQRYVNFVRGETVPGFRTRTTLLGDIVSSAPLYVGAPRGRFSDRLEDEKYSEFAIAKRNRDGMVYVGANDGMLHAFKADSVNNPNTASATRVDERGQEVYAYVPKTVIGNLGALTRPSYDHRYFVDGAPNTSDVFINNEWRSMLAGGLNLGGQGVYAIDITNPSSLGANSAMWEINDRTSEDFRDLGYTYSQPAIVRLHDGSWGVVFGNGYNNTDDDGMASSTGNGVLYIVQAETGQLLRKFDTGRGMAQDPTRAGRPNGLTTPTMVDVEGDRIVDYAYVGDLFGNVWKIDLRSEDSDDWDFAFNSSGSPQPLFVASDGGRNTDLDPATLEIPAKVQPITSRIEVARGRYGVGAVLLFGTGKFLESDDKSITPRADQSFYALFDSFDGQQIQRSQLTRQTIEDEYTLGNNLRGRQTSNREIAGKGWYLDLVSPDNGYEGERVVTNPIVRDDRVIFNTLIPNTDPCGYGGRSWTMVLDLLSGSRLPDAQYDSNGDGEINEEDNQSVSGITQDDGLGGIGAGVTVLTCTDSSCDEDKAITPRSDGSIGETGLRATKGAKGRQSWRQIR